MKKTILFMVGLGLILLLASMAQAGSTNGWISLYQQNNTIRGTTAVVNFSTSNNVTGCALILSTTETNTSGSFDPRTFNMSGGAATLRGVVAQNLSGESRSIADGLNFTNSTFRFNSEAFLDGLYNVSVACVHVNGSRIDIQMANASITIDNRGVPVPSDMTSGQILRRTFTFQSTVDPDARSCTASFDGSSPITPPACAITINGSNCSCTFTDAPFYTYRMSLVSSDGFNTSAASEVVQFTVADINQLSGGGGRRVVVTQPEQPSGEAGSQPLAVVPSEGQPSGTIGDSVRSFVQSIIDGIKNIFSRFSR